MFGRATSVHLAGDLLVLGAEEEGGIVPISLANFVALNTSPA
jgi:hypothetical protein